MPEYAKALLPHLFTLLAIFVSYFLGARKTNYEIKKLSTENNKLQGEEERNLIEFYQGQINSLIKQVKDQILAIEQKDKERVNCEEKLHELEVKYNALSTRFTLLEKKLN